ncbi:MAG: HEAT repeat domain-containing protein, partial [Lentisphaeria bacterium]|nr:HEAT repeat domain-containing protein [Lentisphaeria bacterium]
MKAFALLLCVAVSGWAVDVEPLLPELRGTAPALARDAAGWRALHDEVLAYYLPKLAAEKIGDRKDPAVEYQAICWRAARPGAEIERQAVGEAIAARVTGDMPQYVRLWLLQILQHVGGPEAVPALTELAGSPDGETRAWALRALAENPAAAVGFARLIPGASAEFLAERLASAPPLPALVPVFAKLAAGGEVAMAEAAVRALGRTGDPVGWQALGELPASPLVIQAQLHCAEGMAAVGNPAAVAAYRELLGESRPEIVRCGALRGLLAAVPGEAVALVDMALAQGSPRLQGVGVDYLRRTADEATLNRFGAELATLSPAGQVLLLDVFAARRIAGLRPVALAALSSPAAETRVAAARALAQLGDAENVPVLVTLAENPDGLGKEAFSSLRQMAAPGVDAALLALARDAAGERRLLCVDLLIERRADSALPVLLEYAKQEEDRKVGASAWKGVALLGGRDDLPTLVEVLTAASSDTLRRSAAKAIVAVARREPAASPRTAALLAALPNASPEARIELIGALGELGGAEALAAVREALAAAPELRAAAVRALGTWPDAAPADLLLALARDEADPVLRVLALRGCVRALGQPDAPPPAETVRRLGELLAAAGRDEDRKVVLAGLGQVSHRDALAALRPSLDQPALQAEAVAAVLKVALAVAREDRALADHYLDLVLERAVAGPLREQAETAKRQLEEFDGFLMNWLVAGPFFKTAEKCAVIDMIMEPEGGQAGAVRWQPAPLAGDPAADWQLDFGKIFGGTNRAAYAVTWIRCETGGKVRFELGSDDGIKVWLDDTEVHRNDVARPVRRGEDVAEVELTPGWHRIMLKITQGSGGWGACLRLRAADGGQLSGWRTLADFRDLRIMEQDLGT